MRTARLPKPEAGELVEHALEARICDHGGPTGSQNGNQVAIARLVETIVLQPRGA